MSDLQDRIDRIAALVLAKGSGLTHPSDTEVQIRRILEAWGPRTTYRYLRDHGLLESFVAGLPMPTYAANDPQTILETFQGSWDDFSADALAKLEAWQMESSAAALLPRLAAYAGQLFGSGHAVLARRVLRVAKTVADQERLETHDVKVEDLKVGDLVRSVGAETIGFGPDHLAGRVRSVRVDRDVKTAATTVRVVVHVAQRDATHTFDAPAGTHVEAARLVRPDHAQSLRIAALDRLMRAEEALEGVPAAQSRVARLRHELSATIASDVKGGDDKAEEKYCAKCGEPWPCSDSKRRDIRPDLRAEHVVDVGRLEKSRESAVTREAELELSKIDKAVIEAFTEKKAAESKKLSTDGKTLNGNWMGGSSIAIWEGEKIRLHDLGSKAAQTVQRALKKMTPSSWLVDRSASTKTAAHKCPESKDGKHVPDPSTVQRDEDAGKDRGTDWIVDVNCKNCNRSGSTLVDPTDIKFDTECSGSKNKNHKPDPASLERDPSAGNGRGTDWIVDATCSVCGSSGSTMIDPSTVDFD